MLAFVVATGVPGLDRSDPPIAPAPTVPAMPDSAVQPTWDPRDAGDLPQGDSALPKTLEPPPDAADLPLAGAARMVLGDAEDGLFLLGQDGSWAATTTPSGRAHGSALSDDGTMLASVGPKGLWVTDVRDGRWRRLELPPGPEGVWGRIDVTVTWRGDGQVVLQSVPMGVATVDVDGSGSSTPTTYETHALYGLAQAPDGVAIASGMGEEGPVIREVADGSVSGASTPARSSVSGCPLPRWTVWSAWSTASRAPTDRPTTRASSCSTARRVRRHGVPADRPHPLQPRRGDRLRGHRRRCAPRVDRRQHGPAQPSTGAGPPVVARRVGRRFGRAVAAVPRGFDDAAPRRCPGPRARLICSALLSSGRSKRRPALLSGGASV